MTLDLKLQSATKATTPPVKALSLGDGYEQTFTTAIANEEIWNLSTIPLNDDEANTLESTLNALQGDPFTWIPPYSLTDGDYRLNSKITRSMVGYNASVLQFSIKRITYSAIPYFEYLDNSSFSFNLGYPPDGDYPRTVYAPQPVLDFYNIYGGMISAYLISATVDNGFVSVQIPSATVTGVGNVDDQIPGGGMLFGYGTSIDVLIFQRANGPCYFSGTVKWVIS